MTLLTKQALEQSLYTVLELGYKYREEGLSLLQAKAEIADAITYLVDNSGNCPTEIVRIQGTGKLIRFPKGKP